MATLIQLPKDLLQIIISHLSLCDLAKLSRTCKEFQSLVMSEFTWKNLVNRELTGDAKFLLGENYYFFYKRMYIGHAQLIKRYLADDTLHSKSIRIMSTKCDPDEASGWKLIIYNYKMYLRMPTLSEGLLFAARYGLEQLGRRIVNHFHRSWHNYTLAGNDYDNPIKVAAFMAIIYHHISFINMLEVHASARLWSPATLISERERKLFYKALLSSYVACRPLLNLIKPGRIPSLHAASSKDSAKLQQLISLRGIKSVNKPDRYQCSLLQYCLAFQYNDSIKILIDHGVSITDEFPNSGITALEMAVIKQNIECFRLFFRNTNIQTCISLAIKHTFMDGIHFIYQFCDQESTINLMKHCIHGHLEKILKETANEYCCQFLIDHLDKCHFLDLITIVKLLPYLRIDQSTLTEFYDNKAALSIICMLSRSELTPYQIATSLPCYDLLKLIILLADKELQADMAALQKIYVNIIDTRCRNIISDHDLQVRYDQVINCYLQYLYDNGIEMMETDIVGKYTLT